VTTALTGKAVYPQLNLHVIAPPAAFTAPSASQRSSRYSPGAAGVYRRPAKQSPPGAASAACMSSVELTAKLETIDKKTKAADRDLRELVIARGSTLLDSHGSGRPAPRGS
jgi:hypothetical protein